MLGAIGDSKGFDIWIPASDRAGLDWELSSPFDCISRIPKAYEEVNDIIQEIDVIWLKRGSSILQAMFEVEHTTPIYSGLLRFNDFYLIESRGMPKFSVVSNDTRRSLFLKQVNRPTFKASGLAEQCNFLDYKNVFQWFNRIRN